MELILPALIAVPMLGGVAAWWTERLGAQWPRWISAASLSAVFLLTLLLWQQADFAGVSPLSQPSWLFEFQRQWIPRFGISFHLGLDGLAIVLILLTAFLGVIAVLCSWREIQQHVGFFHLNLLWNLAGVIGVFIALDLFLFFLLWEAMLVPMYFLIALWGHGSKTGRGRIYAATKFFIFTQASGLIMLVAILALVWLNHASSGVWTFNYMELLGAKLGQTAEMWLMLGFFVAFAVKLPAFPFHPWLPDAHSQAPTAGSVDLAGVLLKTGAFGLLRFGITLFPEASQSFAPVGMAMGVVGILYGAGLAMVQTDIKRFVAYTSISHMGFVMLGIYAGTVTALQGVVVQMLAHGLSTGALFVLCGELYERIHTRDFDKMGGLSKRAPRYATALTFFCVASLGLPGTGNFLGEFLILLGTYKVAPWTTAVAATGLIVGAAYSLLIVQRALHGLAGDDSPIEDLNGRERAMMAVMIVLLLALGLYPQPVLDVVQAPLATMAELFTGQAP